MFTDFFYLLKKRKVPVSITEWMVLMESLSKGYITDMDEFYYLARAILVKSEGYYDQYDVAFQEYFKGIETPAEILEQVLEWLQGSSDRTILTDEERELMDRMNLDELLREFEKRLKEQKEQHDGGNYWIGRGGTSPFGHSGYHPAGIRVGGDPGGRHAIQVASERRFRNYRNDLTLDVRSMKMALRRLRQLSRTGPEDELDVEETIDATAKNAGEIDFKWRRNRKNTVKVLLVMDVGGSMTPFARLCSQLFSALNASTHFKDFKYFCFHNCIYDNLYRDIEAGDEVVTDYVLRNLEPDYKTILVGDARMATEELVERYGAIYYYERNETPGIERLRQISEHFTHAVWLNPEDPYYWHHPTVMMIQRLFPMFELTLEGLDRAVKRLMVKR
jgi:hypothetical protein